MSRKPLSQKSSVDYGTIFDQGLEELFRDPTEKLIQLSDLKIRTKDRQLITLPPNTAQILYENDNPNFIEFRGNREMILKARQMGFTTRISAQMFLDTINTPNTQSIIVAQDEANAKRIFQIIN